MVRIVSNGEATVVVVVVVVRIVSNGEVVLERAVSNGEVVLVRAGFTGEVLQYVARNDRHTLPVPQYRPDSH